MGPRGAVVVRAVEMVDPVVLGGRAGQEGQERDRVVVVPPEAGLDLIEAAGVAGHQVAVVVAVAWVGVAAEDVEVPAGAGRRVAGVVDLEARDAARTERAITGGRRRPISDQGAVAVAQGDG
jgi:hypothetical protein